MSATLERAAGDGIKWFPTVTIAKYSPDQTDYAASRLEAFTGHAYTPQGDVLAAWCGDPEDGYAYDRGNQLVNIGLQKLAAWLTGTTSGNQISNGTTVYGYCAVGDGTTAWAATQTDLQGTSKYYNTIDSGYPTNGSTTTPGLITVQSTFGGSVGNFAWNEWAWGVADAAPTAGGTQPTGTAASNNGLLNRKVPSSSLGTKGSGASWVFTTTIQFS